MPGTTTDSRARTPHGLAAPSPLGPLGAAGRVEPTDVGQRQSEDLLLLLVTLVPLLLAVTALVLS